MATDRITRLADALVEVGHRIDQITTELRDLRPAPEASPLAAPGTPAAWPATVHNTPLTGTAPHDGTPGDTAQPPIHTGLAPSPAHNGPFGNPAQSPTHDGTPGGTAHLPTQYGPFADTAHMPTHGISGDTAHLPTHGMSADTAHSPNHGMSGNTAQSPTQHGTPGNTAHLPTPHGTSGDTAYMPAHNGPFANAAQASAHGAGAANPPTLAWPTPGTPVQPTLVYPPPTPPEPPAPPLWQREGFGARALAWAGGAVTLAGVILLLVLAVQRGYLGPLPRVLVGAAFGVGLLGVGLRLHRTPAGRTGALACAATGITVLYLDIVGATTLFEYLPPAAGLVAGLLVATLGVLLADRWHAEPLAVFVVLCCAVSAPVLTGGFVPLLLGFLLVLQLGATPVHLARQWPWLCLATSVPAVLASVAAIVFDTAGTDSTTVAFLGLVTSLAQVGVAAGAAARFGDGTSVGLILLAPVPAMLSASLVPQLAAVVLPGTVGVLLILVWVLGYRRLPTAFALAAGGAGSVAVLQATLTALDGSVVAIVLLAQALLLTLVARTTKYPAALWAAGLFAVTGLGTTLLHSAPPTLLVVAPTEPVPAHVAATAGLTGLLLAATAAAMCVAARRGMVVAGLVTLYGVTATVLSATWLVSPDRTGFLVGHALVTVSWTIGALVLLVRGIDSAFARVAGMSLVGAALAKLVLFDLSSLDGLARVGAFLVAGLVLLAAGTRYARLLASRNLRE